MVIVPGLGATAAFLEDTAERLARSHRVLIVELPGHGSSSGETAAAGALGVDAAARRVLRGCEQLGLRDVTLLGWSLGATVAYSCLAQDRQSRFAALVSVEQTPKLTMAQDWPHAAFGQLEPAGAAELAGSMVDDPAAFARTLLGSSFAAGREPDPGLLERLVAETLRCDPVAMAELLTDVAGQDWRERLPRTVDVPSLFIHGARSQIYPTAVGDWFAQTLTGSRLELFEESGHLPFVEEPQRFADVVLKFIADVAAPHLSVSIPGGE
ncbi:alpha/beta hydrolase [Streptomyces sp. S4.7]|uniref:alpha/beta fold hydrolase n=1 Tax=Streptomyces sp. S4.7 TaxID=2705439 RepID=UPI0013DC7874|nr:alpha/beta hydrolase [Streptomyces sp. S4.7]